MMLRYRRLIDDGQAAPWFVIPESASAASRVEGSTRSDSRYVLTLFTGHHTGRVNRISTDNTEYHTQYLLGRLVNINSRQMDTHISGVGHFGTNDALAG